MTSARYCIVSIARYGTATDRWAQVKVMLSLLSCRVPGQSDGRSSVPPAYLNCGCWPFDVIVCEGAAEDHRPRPRAAVAMAPQMRRGTSAGVNSKGANRRNAFVIGCVIAPSQEFGN